MSSYLVTPQSNESYSAFVKRAHGTLADVEPDAMRRNEMVWQSWESHNGDRLKNQAQSFFPSDKYRFVESVPYFMEHTIQRSTGTQRYDFSELCKMLDVLNGRCHANSYTALVSHHTSDDRKGPEHEPQVLGYSGPFQLGMIPSQDGDSQQDKWAIFGHEHHDRRYSSIFDNRRRRSVEVLRPRSGGAAYFDPIATLGADSPRLPLPVARYQQCEADDVELLGCYTIDSNKERYTMSAGYTAVGQGNTFIPGGQRDRYQPPQGGMPQPQQSAPSASSLTPDDLDSIVNALMSTPQMQWVSEQMDASSGAGDLGSQQLGDGPSSGGAGMPGAVPPGQQLAPGMGSPQQPPFGGQ